MPEALERLASRLSCAAGRLEELVDVSLRESRLRLEAADQLFEESVRVVEAATDEVRRCERDLELCASCDDDDGFEGNEDAFHAVDELEVAQNELETAEKAVESARERRMQALRADEGISGGAILLRQHLDNQLSVGIDFLRLKDRQLREYLLWHPEVAGVSRPAATAYSQAWLRWQPEAGSKLAHVDLVRRLSLPGQTLGSLANRWSIEDPSLCRQLATLRERYRAASTPDEREAVRMASRRGASGRLGELLAENALRPFARSIKMQRRTLTEDEAHITVTDIVLRDLRVPITVGALRIPVGADASVEVKCGGPAYLAQQLVHMQRQVLGHHGEQASFCFLSRDFRRLSRESKRGIATTLGKHRSKIFSLLPEKSVIDSLVWERVVRSD